VPDDDGGFANNLMKQATAELSFRRRVIELIGGILKSDAPNYFKAFVVILLFLGLSASCVLAVFFVNFVPAVTRGQPTYALTYAGILSAHGFVGVLLGAPLTMRMAAFEEARRLEADLTRVQNVNRRKERVQRGGERVDH
jgi:hypothetical protein